MSKKKALDCLNKLNNYAKLPPDHRWVSVVRHYIKEEKFTSTNSDNMQCLCDVKSLYGTGIGSIEINDKCPCHNRFMPS